MTETEYADLYALGKIRAIISILMDVHVLENTKKSEITTAYNALIKLENRLMKRVAVSTNTPRK